MAIELGVVADWGNWSQLGLLARDLNAACESRLGFRYQGGWARGGERGGIVVRLGLVGYGVVLEGGGGDGRGGGDVRGVLRFQGFVGWDGLWQRSNLRNGSGGVFVRESIAAGRKGFNLE